MRADFFSEPRKVTLTLVPKVSPDRQGGAAEPASFTFAGQIAHDTAVGITAARCSRSGPVAEAYGIAGLELGELRLVLMMFLGSRKSKVFMNND